MHTSYNARPRFRLLPQSLVQAIQAGIAEVQRFGISFCPVHQPDPSVVSHRWVEVALRLDIATVDIFDIARRKNASKSLLINFLFSFQWLK
ncbi:hypothetical protein [Polaromonas sp. OV174]|uniref:hypothetical protein n=1 Tax=Polaromonas sp. OV174 TaxID=1855300 RepID=UPI0011601FF0|nr:hypothetical protein [Polaromonas sp. OV174]